MTNTSTLATPEGTLNVPDELNVCDTGAFTVIEYALLVVLEAASTALITKFEVVFEATALKPDILNLDTPFSFTTAVEAPAGKEPDCNSKETLPADSGSLATTNKFVLPTRPFNTVPKEPASVAKTGLWSILI